MTTTTIDTFGGSSGAALESHTPDSGGPWTKVDGDAGKLFLSGANSLKVAGGNADASYTVPVGSADMYAEIAITSLWATTELGVAVRITDKNNFYAIFRTASNQIVIYKRQGGSFTQLRTISSLTLNAGDLIRLGVVGTTLTAYLNGVAIGTSVTDSAFTTQTVAGLITHAGPDLGQITKFEAGPIGGSPPSANHNFGFLGVGT